MEELIKTVNSIENNLAIVEFDFLSDDKEKWSDIYIILDRLEILCCKAKMIVKNWIIENDMNA